MNSLPSELRLGSQAKRFALVAGVVLAGASAAESVTITFDFSHDTNGFFSDGTQARTVLDQAGADVSAVLADDGLEAITPGGGNSWRASYTNPQSNGPAFSVDLEIELNEILIFVGARDHGGPLGSASSGGTAVLSGGTAWQDTVLYRSQDQVSDFGPWGGSLSVSNNASITWDYSTDGSTPATEYNLYSNIVHEMGHVLGLGTAPSWTGQVSGGDFLGAASVAEYGGAVPLDSGSHWQDGTLSVIYGTNTSSETAFDPTLEQGAFKPYTDLDVAALQDIGWQVAPVPEPSACGILMVAAIAFRLRRQRR